MIINMYRLPLRLGQHTLLVAMLCAKYIKCATHREAFLPLAIFPPTILSDDSGAKANASFPKLLRKLTPCSLTMFP